MPGHFPVIASGGRRLFHEEITRKSWCDSLGRDGAVIRMRLRRR